MEKLKFKVSSALKNIIGKDLINDRYIAVFELVKNAYDAGATNIQIRLDNIYDDKNAKIIIEDNGCGMTYEDLNRKWLFVAYSEKKDIGDRKENYRNRIKRETAGAKGVGRFSCDRLGSQLRVLTKTKDEIEINELIVDWDKFEEDDEKEFMEIDVTYNRKENVNSLKHGTILQITSLREKWTQKEIKALKKSLLKLVNPEINANKENIDEFKIYIDCSAEENNDRKVKNVSDKINGLVSNDIFEKIDIKTVSIDVFISADGKSLITILTDRGELIFKVSEENKYNLLKNIKFKAFYLNTAAKQNFTRNMGVPPVQYGSIFIYKNGFRIYPYGQPGNDFFGVDKRKSQGYNRYLGTRDMMGRIQVLGTNKDLYETTSRDGGFVNTNTLQQLEDCFSIKVHRVLEKYVSQIVDWVRPNKETGEKELEPKDVIDDIIKQAMSIQKKGDKVDVEYGENIKSYIEEKEGSSLSSRINKVSQIAKQSGNEALFQEAKKIKESATNLQKQKVEDEKYIEKIEDDINIINEEKKLFQKQNFFLSNIVDPNVKNIVSGLHLVFTYSETIQMQLKDLIDELGERCSVEIMDIISDIELANRKINRLALLGIKGKGNFELDTMKSKYDLSLFIEQYVSIIKTNTLKIKVEKTTDDFHSYFDASEIGLIIDNIISNSKRASAKMLSIKLSKDDKYTIIEFINNGIPVTSDISDPSILFELGVTTTKGTGIGLYTIKEVVETMDGYVKIDSEYTEGFKITMGVML